MTRLTAFEIDVLNGIAYHEMSPANGGTPERIEDTGCWCWVEDFSKALSPAQVKGVLSSLVQKALVRVEDYDQDNTVHFTPEGFAAWQANDQGANR